MTLRNRIDSFEARCIRTLTQCISFVQPSQPTKLGPAVDEGDFFVAEMCPCCGAASKYFPGCELRFVVRKIAFGSGAIDSQGLC